MCEADKQCAPCAAKTVKQAEPAAPLVVWGPFSDEVPSRDKVPKLVKVSAIERALPQLLRRGVVSVHHDDALISARLLELATVDASRTPALTQAMVAEVTHAYGGLPTGMVTVTPAIAAVFPRIAHRVGERLPFAASEPFNDTRTSAAVQADIREGRLDSYSISATQFGTKYANHCNPDGCQVVQEIPDIELSAVTFTSYERTRSTGGESQAANPGAGFVIVQQTVAASSKLGNSFSDPKSLGAVDEPAVVPEVVTQEADAAPATPPPDAVAPPALPPAAAEVAPIVPEPIKQETDAAPAPDASAPKTDVEAVLAQVVKRLTDLEVEVALLKGRKEEAPAPAAAPPTEEKDAKKETVKETVALKQTIPEPAAVSETATTPTPTSPGTPDVSGIKTLIQDMDNGDPSALKRLRNHLGGRKA